jgi:c-di-GMP-binding flagellar brake protein YcgR
MEEASRPARNFIRVNTQLEARCIIVRMGQTIEKKGIVTDVSGGGLKILSKDHLTKQGNMLLKMEIHDGPIELPCTVVSSEIQWYVGDEGKKTQWSSSIKFERLDSKARSRIIKFVHSLAAEIREARIKKTRK